jgi:predicted Zn finger-like uncharacterized protein
MYTQCPECLARFRVAAADLSAAGGTVRCGRCGSSFNALASLSDTVPPSPGYVVEGGGPGEEVELGTPDEPVAGVEFHFTADDIESVFAQPGGWPRRTGPGEPASDAAEPQAPGAEPEIGVVSENRPFEDITLEGEGISIESILGIDTDEDKPTGRDGLADEGEPTDDDEPTDEFEILRDVPESAYPEEEEDEAEARVAAPLAAGTAARAARGDAVSPFAYAEAASAPAAEVALAREPSPTAALEPESTRSRPGRSSLAWSIGCLLVALALVAQIAHQYRQDLVRHPQVGPWLRDIYARIGVPLSPNWDLGAFELRQWGSGGGPDADGRLTLRASLTNRATFAQPHPILRLELDDRFGDSVAVRDFEPAEYLKNPAEASRLLGPGASAEAELVIVDTGEDAVGYQLDVCLRESATILRCAQGPG